MTIKVLPRDWWQETDSWDFARTIENYEEIEPIFNRNGQYYHTIAKVFWFESDGRAWKVNTNKKYTSNYAPHFLWRLKHYDVVPLSQKEIEQFRWIINTTADKKLRNYLRTRIQDTEYAMNVQFGGELRDRLRLYRQRKESKARLKKFKEERGIK